MKRGLHRCLTVQQTYQNLEIHNIYTQNLQLFHWPSMKCYLHQATDAVGIHSECGQGVSYEIGMTLFTINIAMLILNVLGLEQSQASGGDLIDNSPVTLK